MQLGDLVVKKANEYGAVEVWMNERVRRACPNACADYIYGFLEVLLRVKLSLVVSLFRAKAILSILHSVLCDIICWPWY